MPDLDKLHADIYTDFPYQAEIGGPTGVIVAPADEEGQGLIEALNIESLVRAGFTDNGYPGFTVLPDIRQRLGDQGATDYVAERIRVIMRPRSSAWFMATVALDPTEQEITEVYSAHFFDDTPQEPCANANEPAPDLPATNIFAQVMPPIQLSRNVPHPNFSPEDAQNRANEKDIMTTLGQMAAHSMLKTAVKEGFSLTANVPTLRLDGMLQLAGDFGIPRDLLQIDPRPITRSSGLTANRVTLDDPEMALGYMIHASETVHTASWLTGIKRAEVAIS